QPDGDWPRQARASLRGLSVDHTEYAAGFLPGLRGSSRSPSRAAAAPVAPDASAVPGSQALPSVPGGPAPQDALSHSPTRADAGSGHESRLPASTDGSPVRTLACAGAACHSSKRHDPPLLAAG